MLSIWCSMKPAIVAGRWRSLQTILSGSPSAKQSADRHRQCKDLKMQHGRTLRCHALVVRRL